MKEIIAIALREIAVRLRRRSFYMGGLIVPAFLTLSLIFPSLLITRAPVGREVIVLDQSGDPALFSSIDDRVRNTSIGKEFALSQVIVSPQEDIEKVKRDRRMHLGTDSGLAVMVLPRGVLEDVQPEYYASNIIDPSLTGLSQITSLVITERRLGKLGIDPDEIERKAQKTDLKLIEMTAEGEIQPRFRGLVHILVPFFLMFFGVSKLGQSVMLGMLEEKQSKVVEVLISSVKPIHLMAGKLLGIGAVGLLQLAIWLVAVISVWIFASTFLNQAAGEFQYFPSDLFGAFFGYFILGYFMYGTLYAILGAMLSRPEDIAVFQRPLTILNMIPILIVWVIFKDPNGPLSVFFSLIPFFAPTLMFLRMLILPPPVWQIILSIVLILITTIGATWIAAKVFRVGILLSGKKLTLAQIGRWLRYS